MSGPIVFNYTAADAATEKIASLVTAMETNTESLKRLYDQLLQEFQGSGAQGYQEVMEKFQQRLTAYDGKIKQLNITMMQNINSDGSMHQTDIAQGNRFREIHV